MKSEEKFFINEGLEQNYEIEVIVTEEGEQVRLTGDLGLWKRALRNLLGNSIRHNPSGCRVTAALKIQEGSVCYEIRDSGTGIPGKIADILEGKGSEAERRRAFILWGFALRARLRLHTEERFSL